MTDCSRGGAVEGLGEKVLFVLGLIYNAGPKKKKKQAGSVIETEMERMEGAGEREKSRDGGRKRGLEMSFYVELVQAVGNMRLNAAGAL